MEKGSLVEAFLGLTTEIDFFWNMFLVLSAAFIGWMLLYRNEGQFYLRRILAVGYFLLLAVNFGSIWMLADLRIQVIRDLTVLVGSRESRLVDTLTGFPWYSGWTTILVTSIMHVLGVVLVWWLGFSRHAVERVLGLSPSSRVNSDRETFAQS